jgi:hypothetical protein
LLISVVIVFGLLGCAMPSVRGRSSVMVILFSALLTIVGFPILSIQAEAVSQGVDTTSARAVLVFAAAGDGGGEISEAMQDRLQTAVKQLEKNPRRFWRSSAGQHSADARLRGGSRDSGTADFGG